MCTQSKYINNVDDCLLKVSVRTELSIDGSVLDRQINSITRQINIVITSYVDIFKCIYLLIVLSYYSGFYALS